MTRVRGTFAHPNPFATYLVLLVVLTLSSFAPNRDLGLLLAAAMPVAYTTTALFVPRMLVR